MPRTPVARSLVLVLLTALVTASVPLFSNSTPGTLDGSFDSDGRKVVDFGGLDKANDVVVQPDGKIVAVGSSSGNFAVTRLNPDGSPDTTFSGDGRLDADFGGNDVAQAVALTWSGEILVAGYTDAVGAGDFAHGRCA